jgi:hypothetical protein
LVLLDSGDRSDESGIRDRSSPPAGTPQGGGPAGETMREGDLDDDDDIPF